LTAEGSFWDHLEELRRRLFTVLLALVVATAAAFAFGGRIMEAAAAPAGGVLLALSPEEAVIASMKLALAVGAAVSSPVTFLQIWAFIAPGLYRNERKAFLTVVASCLFLFAAGAAFAWFVMLKPTLLLFRSFETGAVQGNWSVSGYIGFLGTFILVFGIAFQLPLAIMILSRLGIVSPKALGKYRRHVIVGILVISAVLTPPDPVTQVTLAIPLYLLFEISLVLAGISGGSRSRADSPASPAGAGPGLRP